MSRIAVAGILQTLDDPELALVHAVALSIRLGLPLHNTINILGSEGSIIVF